MLIKVFYTRKEQFWWNI